MACFVRVGSSVAGVVWGAVWAARVVEMRVSDRAVARTRVPRGMQRGSSEWLDTRLKSRIAGGREVSPIKRMSSQIFGGIVLLLVVDG
jgi:hypothetical protein